MTKANSNVVTDFVAPIVVLVLICAVMSGLLAATNKVTAPIIDAAEKSAADSFEKVEAQGLPSTVTEVYKAANGSGYTFSITAQGYGGKNTLKMAVGIAVDTDESGTIIGRLSGVKVLDHKETAGLGSKITTDQRFIGDFLNKGADEIDGIDRISGATFSSNYYKAAIKDAFAAFELVKGGTLP